MKYVATQLVAAGYPRPLASETNREENEMDLPGNKPKAFVIMPFGEGFDEIYSLFIHSTLVQAGYDVMRADQIKGSQNILKDIIHGIAFSDLIVADLTDSNPNVYYELGVAHSLGKPVIMLAQDIADIPFDLQSYRTILYKTHFAEINRAQQQLLETAKGLSDSHLPFGSPMTDFLPEYHPFVATQQNAGAEELGLLDYISDVEEGFSSLGTILTEFSAETNQLTISTQRTTTDLNSLKSNPTGFSARQARAVVVGHASRLSSYANSLLQMNNRYTTILTNVRTSFEWYIKTQLANADKNSDQSKQFSDVLATVEENSKQARNSISTMSETIRTSPSVEKSFNRAKALAVRQLDRYAENIDQTIAMISRAREIINP